MLVYCTRDDVEAWLRDDVPDNIDQLIRIASGQVTYAIRSAFFDVDSAGKPSDPTVLQALNDATCAQIEFWIAAGVNPASSSVQETVVPLSSGIGSGKVAFDRSSASALTAARTSGAQQLCQEALMIIGDAGLSYGKTTVYG